MKSNSCSCFSIKGRKIFSLLFLLFSNMLYSYAALDADTKGLSSISPTINQPLIVAIQENDLQQVIALIRDRKNVNGRDFFGYSPLHYASRCGNKVAVLLLIEAKALLNQVSIKNHHTPLLLAIRAGNKDVVSLLLKAGANTEIVNRQGYNALHLAIKYQRKDLVKLLLQSGVSYSNHAVQGYSPISMAIQVGSFPIVQILLNQKAVIESKDKEGYSELHWAIKENQLASFRALLKSGKFNTNAKAANGITPLHLAAVNWRKNPMLLKYLVRYSLLLEINAQDATGSTPLHYATTSNQLKAVCVLLNYLSIDPNIQDNAGQTALHYAIQNGYLPIIRKLLTCSCKSIFVKNKEEITPMELAIRHKNCKIYKVLLSYTKRREID